MPRQGALAVSGWDWCISAIVAAARRFVAIVGYWGATFPKMGDSLPRTPLNHYAKFDAAGFILAGEIRNRTNNKKQTVTDISTPCLSACVDNKHSVMGQDGYIQYC